MSKYCNLKGGCIVCDRLFCNGKDESSMEPSYTEWKPYLNASKQERMLYCPNCERNVAKLMKRFYTNRDGETEAQFRVECPICKECGKTYLHESVARLSWAGNEHKAKNGGVFPR